VETQAQEETKTIVAVAGGTQYHARWKVFIAQFGTGMASSELESLGRFRDLITVHRFEYPQSQSSIADCDETNVPEHGLAECEEALASGVYSFVILDEANLGPMLQLFPVKQLIGLLDARAPEVELVITGRYAHPSLLDRADLVTEMRELVTITAKAFWLEQASSNEWHGHRPPRRPSCAFRRRKWLRCDDWPSRGMLHLSQHEAAASVPRSSW